MHDEIEARREVVGRMVQFILNTTTISPKQGIGEISREVRNADIGSKEEFHEALAKVIHLAREMLALERIDTSFRAAEHALAVPAPTVRRSTAPASCGVTPTAPKPRRARKPRRGVGQRENPRCASLGSP